MEHQLIELGEELIKKFRNDTLSDKEKNTWDITVIEKYKENIPDVSGTKDNLEVDIYTSTSYYYEIKRKK